MNTLEKTNDFTRSINLKLEIDWDNYENVDEQLIVEDAIREVADGVRISISEPSDDFTRCLELLRDLADLQNGPPLETYRKEWEKTMSEVYDFLKKYEPSQKHLKS